MYLLYAPPKKFGKLPAKTPLITEEVLFTNNVAYCAKYFWKKHHTLQGCEDMTPRWLARARQKRDLFKILFIVTGGFGDVMWCMPFMKAARMRWPRAKILVATEERTMPLFAGVPYADLCVKNEYWNLQALIRNSEEVWDFGGIATMYKKEMTMEPVDATFMVGELPRPKDRKDMRPQLVLTVEEGKAAERILKKQGLDPWRDKFVCIGLESSTPNRNWPYSYTNELTQRLLDKGIKVVWLSKNKDIGKTYAYTCGCGYEFSLATESQPDRIAWQCPACHKENDIAELKQPDGLINLAGKTNIRQAMAIIAQSNLFIGPNSALMVIGTALEIPTIGIFGAFDPKRITKYYDKFIYFWGHLDCAPCSSHWTECPKGHPAPCMRAITPAMVYEKTMQMLTKYAKDATHRRPIE
jgi:ADP-heptose:LPS heptosyltransferase